MYEQCKSTVALAESGQMEAFWRSPCAIYIQAMQIGYRDTLDRIFAIQDSSYHKIRLNRSISAARKEVCSNNSGALDKISILKTIQQFIGISVDFLSGDRDKEMLGVTIGVFAYVYTHSECVERKKLPEILTTEALYADCRSGSNERCLAVVDGILAGKSRALLQIEPFVLEARTAKAEAAYIDWLGKLLIKIGLHGDCPAINSSKYTHQGNDPLDNYRDKVVQIFINKVAGSHRLTIPHLGDVPFSGIDMIADLSSDIESICAIQEESDD
jgi:hypothetical protein